MPPMSSIAIRTPCHRIHPLASITLGSLAALNNSDISFQSIHTIYVPFLRFGSPRTIRMRPVCMADRSSLQQRQRAQNEDVLSGSQYWQEDSITIKAGASSRHNRRAQSAAPFLNSFLELQRKMHKQRNSIAAPRQVILVQKPHSSESVSTLTRPASPQKPGASDSAQSRACGYRENDLAKSESEAQKSNVTALATKSDHKSYDSNEKFEENISYNEYTMGTLARREIGADVSPMPTSQFPRPGWNPGLSSSKSLTPATISMPDDISTRHSQSSCPTKYENVDRHVSISTPGTLPHPQEIYMPEASEQTKSTESFSITKGMLLTSSRHDYSNFQAEWDVIRRMRLDIWGLRSRVHEARDILRQKQLAKSEADDRYMLRVHADELGIIFRENGSSLSELRKQCRETRDEYGPLENDCTNLEDHLSNQEFQLTRLEEQFYLRWNSPSSPNCAPGSPQAEDNPQISYHSFDIEEAQSFYHPLVTKYLSKLGDLDIFKERLHDLLDEKTALEAEKESRKKFNMTLDPEDQAWLDDSERMGHEIYEQLQRANAEYQDLRSKCVAEGLIDENGDPSGFQELEKAQFRDEKDLKVNEQTSEYVKFPLLIPLHGANGYEIEDIEFNSDHGQAPFTSNRRVNEWILRNLRSSPLDVQLLAELQKHIRDDNHAWQLHVLFSWFKDETNKTRESSRELSYNSSLTTQTSVGSEDSGSFTGLVQKD
jgi:hypothetical protein